MTLPSKTHLLPEAHDLEALEVVQVSPLGGLLTLLGEVALVELALDLLGLPLLPEGNSAGTAGELLDNEAGERDGRERAEWRGTESSTVEAGPSTRTCGVHVNLRFIRSSIAPGSSVPPGSPPWCAHTRL
jgi:hypothetical protein